MSNLDSDTETTLRGVRFRLVDGRIADRASARVGDAPPPVEDEVTIEPRKRGEPITLHLVNTQGMQKLSRRQTVILAGFDGAPPTTPVAIVGRDRSLRLTLAARTLIDGCWMNFPALLTPRQEITFAWIAIGFAAGCVASALYLGIAAPVILPLLAGGIWRVLSHLWLLARRRRLYAGITQLAKTAPQDP